MLSVFREVNYPGRLRTLPQTRRPYMKIGASTYSLLKAIKAGDLDVLGVFDWLAQNGAEHIEIVPVADISFAERPELADTFAAKAKEVGLDISCYTFGASFIDRTEEEFEAELQRVREQVDIAVRMGSRLVRHDVASRPQEKATDEQFEQDLPLLIEACRQITDYAAKCGVTTMIENHGFHVQGARRVLALHHAVARDNFRLMVDIGNFIGVERENVLKAVAQCAPFAGMVHVKDHHVRTTQPEPMEGWRDRGDSFYTQASIAGEGDVGIEQAIKSLVAAGFDGYLSLEFEGPEEARYANLKGMENLRRYLGQG